jgi:hypothetical protein
MHRFLLSFSFYNIPCRKMKIWSDFNYYTPKNSLTSLTKYFSHVTISFQISSQLFNWIFCSPCIHFLKTSKTFHKMTLTSVTLIVVCLLVVSPIIFLLSFAKNQQTTSSTKHCDECVVTVPPPTCRNEICQKIASSIQAKIDWK